MRLVRTEPRARADPIVRLDHHIVELTLDPQYQQRGSGWRKVRLPDGREGFVSAECVRSQVDYRAGFAKVDDARRMVFFIAGD